MVVSPIYSVGFPQAARLDEQYGPDLNGHKYKLILLTKLIPLSGNSAVCFRVAIPDLKIVPAEHFTAIGVPISNKAIHEALEGKLAYLKLMASRRSLIEPLHELILLKNYIAIPCSSSCSQMLIIFYTLII